MPAGVQMHATGGPSTLPFTGKEFASTAAHIRPRAGEASLPNGPVPLLARINC